MTRLLLLPGMLPLHEARWAMRSRLVAADGVLEVHRGRRVERIDVTGCVMHPAGPVRDLAVSCAVVLATPDGDARCAVDLADWVPGGEMRADRRIGRQLGEPFTALRDALAEATGTTVSSTAWRGERPALVSAADTRAAWAGRLLLLALAVVAVVAPLTGVTAVGLVGGVAAIGLALLGLSPVRRWHPRSDRPSWTVRAGRLADEVSLTADGSVLRVMHAGTGLAGALPVGELPWQVDRLDADDDAIQLSSGGVLAVDLPRSRWGSGGLDALRTRLDQVEGLRSRDRDLDRRAVTALDAVREAYRPGSLTADLGIAALAVVAAASLPPAVSIGYAVAAVVAGALAVELVVARRRPRPDRKDPA